MSDEYRPVLRGLVTDPNSQVSGSDGLIECDNAMSKRIGLLEPRGGIQLRYSPPASADGYSNTVFVRENSSLSLWFVANNGTNSRIYKWGEAAYTLALSGTQQGVRCEPFADRQCWTFQNALRMLDLPDSPSSASFRRLPGAPRAPAPWVMTANISAATTLLLGPHEGVAYRTVVLRHITTAQGARAVQGAPSDRVVMWNVQPSDRADVRIVVPLGTLSAGDEIQLYRTDTIAAGSFPPPDVDPGDEMQMITSYRLQTAPALSDTWTYLDSGSNDTWSGPSLYTNDTQEGIAESNYRIRQAHDVAFYQNMAFYAQGTPGQTKSVTLRSVNFNSFDPTVDPTNKANTLYSQAFTGDVVGSAGPTAFVTNCNPTVATMLSRGLSVGMYVNLAANDPLDPTGSPVTGEIVTINSGANTLEVSIAGSTVGSTGSSLVAWDWVGLQLYSDAGPKYRVFLSPKDSGTGWSASSGVFYYYSAAGTTPKPPGYGVADAVAGGAQDIERAWAARYKATTTEGALPRVYTAANDSFPYAKECVLRFEYDNNPNDATDSSFQTPFEVISSKPFAFSQQLGLAYSANLCRSTNEGGFARLYYSKVGLPESIPLGNYVEIGDAGSPIVRIVATTDKLFVFKSDGIWVVYGETPETLIVQPFDPTTRAISFVSGGVETLDTSPWFRKVGNTVFAWTTKGIVAVDSSGVTQADAPIASFVKSLTPYTSSNKSVTATRPWAATDLRNSIVLFGAQSITNYANGITLAYHIETRTWSTWSSQLATPLGLNTIFRGSGESALGNLWCGAYNGIAGYVLDQQQDSALVVSGLPFSYADSFAGPDAATNQAFTVASVSGRTATITPGTWAPIEGCIVSQSGATYMVISKSGNVLTLDRTGMAAGSAGVTVWPVKQTLTYAATTEGTPWIEKYFQQTYIGFQRLRGGTKFRQRWRARDVTTPSSWYTEQYPTEDTQTPLTSAIGLTANREFECTRDIATAETRCTGLEVTVELNQAAVYSQIDSLSLMFDPRSDRVAGRS